MKSTAANEPLDIGATVNDAGLPLWPWDQLPEGWIAASVGRVAGALQYGSSVKATTDATGIPVLRMGNIQDGFLDVRELKYVQETQENVSIFLLEPGDIVFNRTNSPELVGKAAVFESRARMIFASYLIRIRVTDAVQSKYLCRWINSSWGREWATAVRTDGVSQSNINATKLADMPLPVPPLAEQRRIVEKVEALLARLNAARDRLAKATIILKRLRQSALAAACSGRLTADWRAAHGIALLKPDNETENVPASWQSLTVESVIEGLKYGTAAKCEYGGKGAPVLRIPNIGDGAIKRDDLKYAELDKRESAQLRLTAGDLLMVRSNGSVSLLGKTALVGPDDEGSAYAGYLIRLRPDRNKVLPEFLNAVLGSFAVRLQIELPARSTSGVNNINSDEVRALPILLPPLAEQREIMRRLDAVIALVAKIETRVAAGTMRADKMIQSTLSKAFRGELVPTEAKLAEQEGRDFETAEQLLERIRAEHQPSPTRRTRSAAPTDNAPAPANARRKRAKAILPSG